MYTTKRVHKNPIIITCETDHISVDMKQIRVAAWIINKHRTKHNTFHNVLGVVLAIVCLYFFLLTFIIIW
jgi:hypothetical protein